MTWMIAGYWVAQLTEYAGPPWKMLEVDEPNLSHEQNQGHTLLRIRWSQQVPQIRSLDASIWNVDLHLLQKIAQFCR